MDQPRTRQELYDQIAKSSKTQFILEEMKRLGFWEKDQPFPALTPEEAAQKKSLEQQLSKLRTQLKNLKDAEKLQRQLRKQRLLDSRKKRAETKQRKQQQRLAKAKAWQQQQQQAIVYLGKTVSYDLNQPQSDATKLENHQLPLFNQAKDLAKAMQLSLSQLRFLSFDRKVSTVHHYQQFYLEKKTGGQRLISAPMPKLKQAQYWILQHILDKINVSSQAHGFVKQRSIISNAKPHIAQATIINMDLKDFFPRITYPRVKGLFVSLGYSKQIATILALLCTEAKVEQVECDGKTYYVQQGSRHLPQGAPTSPAISNLICRGLDHYLSKLSQDLGFVYTRYADDLTFSCPKDKRPQISKLFAHIKQAVKKHGFTIHPDKTRVLHQGRRQEVTGLVVNQKLSIDRKTLKRFRATLFQIEKDGLANKHWGNHLNTRNLLASLQGYARFVHMVDPIKGKPLLEKTAQLQAQYGQIQTQTQTKTQTNTNKQSNPDIEPSSKNSLWSRFWKKK